MSENSRSWLQGKLLKVRYNSLTQRQTYTWLPLEDEELRKLDNRNIPLYITLNFKSYKNKAFQKYLNIFNTGKEEEYIYLPITEEIKHFLHLAKQQIDECKSLYVQYVKDQVTKEQFIKSFTNHVKKKKLIRKLNEC